MPIKPLVRAPWIARVRLGRPGVVGIGVLLVLATVGISAQLWPARAPRASRSSKVESAHPTKAAKAAVQLPFPSSRGAAPKSLVTTYDATKDRSKMTLELREFLSVTSPMSPLRNATIRLVSQFSGRSRPAHYAELSIECTLTASVSQVGTLAPSSPPGHVVADGKQLPVQASSLKNLGYKTKATSGGTLESLSFKIRTRDLLEMARARDVQLNLGAAQVRLTPANIADLSEFAARMKPGS